MRTTLLFTSLALSLTALACGGNVSVGSGGTGGDTSAGGGSGGTSSTGTTSTGPNFAACSGPGQCVLAVPGCCASCVTPELGDLEPVNSAAADDYKQSVCPEPMPCPECAAQPNPNLFAYCPAGTCVAADVRNEAFSECKTSDDCKLRNGAECCEGCVGDAWNLVAVNTTAAETIKSIMCAPDGGCSKCLPQYPPDAVAVCGENGHCAVAFVNQP